MSKSKNKNLYIPYKVMMRIKSASEMGTVPLSFVYEVLMDKTDCIKINKEEMSV